MLGDIQLSLCDKRGDLEIEVSNIKVHDFKVKIKFPQGYSSERITKQGRIQGIASSMGEGVSGQWQEMSGQGQDFCCPADSGSSVPTTTHLSSALRWLCPPGNPC